MKNTSGRYASPSQKPANCIAFTLLIIALSACSASQQLDSPQNTALAQPPAIYGQAPASRLSQEGLDQNQILQVQASGSSKVEVLFAAKVLKLLPDDTRGLPHQRFLLILNNGTTVLVAHDTKYAPKVPIRAGDTVVIQGEYIWNKKGGLVHWTHHSDTPRHQSGYIDFNGMRYQ